LLAGRTVDEAFPVTPELTAELVTAHLTPRAEH
jgi:hypothetical protein